MQSTGGVVNLAAGRSVGMDAELSGMVAGLAPLSGGGLNSAIVINAPVRSSNNATYNVNIFSTGSVLQQTNATHDSRLPSTIDAGIQTSNNSPTTGGLRVITYNNPGAFIDLQNSKTSGAGICSTVVGSGNCAGPLLFESRLVGGGAANFANGDIKYSSINGTTIFGLGTAADIVFHNPRITVAQGSIKATNVYFYGYGSDSSTQNNDGGITLNVPITNSDINGGKPGGSLNFIADGPIVLNGDTAPENTLIGSRTTKPNGDVTIEKFDHNLKLVSSSDIGVTGSIYLEGALDLRAGASGAEVANLSLQTSPNPVAANGSYDGSVSVSVPAGRAFPVEVVASSINIGAPTAPVKNVTLDSSAASLTVNGVSGNFGRSVDALIGSEGDISIYYTGAMTVKAGTVSATTTGSNDIITAGANARIAGDNLKIVGTGGTGNTLEIFGGNANSETSAGGIALAAADAVLFGDTSVSIRLGDSLLAKGGNSSITGKALAAGIIDPAADLVIISGGNIVLEAGVGPGSQAQILNQGDVKLTVGGSTPYVFTFTRIAGVGTATGLILIGGNGTGLLGGKANTVLLGDQIQLSGGGLVTIYDPGRAAATVQANSPRPSDDLLSYIIYAANEETRAARIRTGRGTADNSDLPSCN